MCYVYVRVLVHACVCACVRACMCAGLNDSAISISNQPLFIPLNTYFAQ